MAPFVLVRYPLSDGPNFVGNRQPAMRCGVQTLSYGWIVFMLGGVAVYVKWLQTRIKQQKALSNYQMYVA